MYDGRETGDRCDLGLLALIVQPDVRLNALLDCYTSQRSRASVAQVSCLATTQVDTQNDVVHADFNILAVGQADELTLSDNFDGAILQVEEVELHSVVDLGITFELQGLPCEVLDNPLLAVHQFLEGLLYGGFLWSRFSRSGLSWNCSFGLLLWNRLGSRARRATCELRLEESFGASTILLTPPVTDVALSLGYERNQSLHYGEIRLKPCLFWLRVSSANLVSVKENLRFHFFKVFDNEIVSGCRVPEVELRTSLDHFQDIHWRLPVLLKELLCLVPQLCKSAIGLAESQIRGLLES